MITKKEIPHLASRIAIELSQQKITSCPPPDMALVIEPFLHRYREQSIVEAKSCFWRHFPQSCEQCGGEAIVFTRSNRKNIVYDGDPARCTKCDHTGEIFAHGDGIAEIVWEE